MAEHGLYLRTTCNSVTASFDGFSEVSRRVVAFGINFNQTTSAPTLHLPEQYDAHPTRGPAGRSWRVRRLEPCFTTKPGAELQTAGADSPSKLPTGFLQELVSCSALPSGWANASGLGFVEPQEFLLDRWMDRSGISRTFLEEVSSSSYCLIKLWPPSKSAPAYRLAQGLLTLLTSIVVF